MRARRIVSLEDCSTYSWQIHSHNYPSAHDAKIMAARVFTGRSSGVLVRKQKGLDMWAVFYWDRKEADRARE
jgi:hypothetical protein